MAFVIKLLAATATTAGATTSLYTVSSPATGAIVNNVKLTAAAGVTGLVKLYYKKSGGSNQQVDVVTPAMETVAIKPELTLGLGDAIAVSTSVAMDCIVSGVEKV